MTAEPVAQGKPAQMAVSFRPNLQHVFALGFFLVPVLAAVVPLGLAPLFGVLTLLALVVYLREERAWPWPSRRTQAFAVAIIAWFTLTLVWTVAPSETLRFLPRAALYVVAGLTLVTLARRLPAELRPATDRWLVIGTIVGAILFMIEVASDGAIVGALHWMVHGETRDFEAGELNRGAAVFGILSFLASISARRRFGWPAAMATLALAAAPAFLAQGSKAAFGFGLGLAVVALGLVLRDRIVPLLAGAVFLLIATAPLQPVVLSAVPGPWATSNSPSVTHRLLIWDFVGDRVAERPFLGWGLNASRAIPGGKKEPTDGTELLPLHPHNTPLQLWLELGGLGALLFAAGLAGAVLRMRKLFRERTDLAFACAAVVAAVSEAAVGYGAWQGWWLSGLWALAAIIAVVAPGPSSQSRIP